MNEQLIANIAYETLLRTGAPTGNREWQKVFSELLVREAMSVTKTYTSNQGWDYSAPVALARHFGVGNENVSNQ